MCLLVNFYEYELSILQYMYENVNRQVQIC